jgi:hypothetical protein
MNEKVTPGLISMMRTIQAKNLIQELAPLGDPASHVKQVPRIVMQVEEL